MEKLKLSATELGAKEILSREQLKKVLGGNGIFINKIDFFHVSNI